MERPLTELALTVPTLGPILRNISLLFQLMSYSTGNLGRKGVLLALLADGIEQSDLEGMQTVRLEY